MFSKPSFFAIYIMKNIVKFIYIYTSNLYFKERISGKYSFFQNKNIESTNCTGVDNLRTCAYVTYVISNNFKLVALETFFLKYVHERNFHVFWVRVEISPKLTHSINYKICTWKKFVLYWRYLHALKKTFLQKMSVKIHKHIFIKHF